MSRRSRKTSDLVDLAAEFQHYPFWFALAASGFVLLVLEVIAPALFGHSKPAGPSGFNYAALFLPLFKIVGWILAGLILAFGVTGVLSRSAKRLGDRALIGRQTSQESIRQLSWQEFESVLAEAYRRQGYDVQTRGGPKPDGGVDLEIRKQGQRLLVQAKHWKAMVVHLPQLRELWGAVADERADGAIFVTSGAFTADAVRWAANKNFRLIDGSHLSELIPSVARVAPQVQASRACPSCGRLMVQRTARRGLNAGKSFWGCSGYPSCRHTEPIDA